MVDIDWTINKIQMIYPTSWYHTIELYEILNLTKTEYIFNVQ